MCDVWCLSLRRSLARVRECSCIGLVTTNSMCVYVCGKQLKLNRLAMTCHNVYLFYRASYVMRIIQNIKKTHKIQIIMIYDMEKFREKKDVIRSCVNTNHSHLNSKHFLIDFNGHMGQRVHKWIILLSSALRENQLIIFRLPHSLFIFLTRWNVCWHNYYMNPIFNVSFSLYRIQN